MDEQRGLRLWLILLSLNIGLFLTTLDGTIVATALVSIAAEFNNYDQSSWIVTAYLVTYSSFLMIFARLSDIVGRKTALTAGLVAFLLACLACALSRSSDQIIIFRAFQGIGASGIYAPALVIALQVCPKELAAVLSALLSVVFALASAVGPVVGGAITTTTTWRWCFWLNLPVGALVLALTSVIVPKDVFPEGEGGRRAFLKIDFLGATLCLVSSIMTIIPLQVGGVQYAWNETPIIIMFAAAAVCWIALAGWEVHLHRSTASSPLLPLFPVHILHNRVISACIATLMLTGIGFTSTVVYLPQKFEVANDLSSARAGVYMLPFVITSALAGIVVGATMTKKNLAAPWTLFGNCMQLLGIGLMSSLEGNAITGTAQFAFQGIAGFGFGCTMSSAFILARIEVAKADLASTVGALTQLRILGGVIGVGFCRVVLFAHVSDQLGGQLDHDQIESVLASVTNIDKLSLSQADLVRTSYGSGFAKQNRILTYVAAVNVLVGLLTFRRHAKPLTEVDASSTRPADNATEEVQIVLAERTAAPAAAK